MSSIDQLLSEASSAAKKAYDLGVADGKNTALDAAGAALKNAFDQANAALGAARPGAARSTPTNPPPSVAKSAAIGENRPMPTRPPSPARR